MNTSPARRRSRSLVLAATVVTLTAASVVTIPQSVAAPSSPTSVAAAGPTAQQVLDGMTLAEKVGQLIMVDASSTDPGPATRAAIQRSHVGSVILDGDTDRGVDAVRTITDRLQRFAPADVKLLVSTDQEGGEVQRLAGPGFSRLPSALYDGGRSRVWVRGHARQWGAQLKAAGVNVDLAPVADTVPPGDTDNPPIGDLDREFGHYTNRVTAKGTAYTLGLQTAGVDPVLKHFPGLGRVTGNTDTTSGVTDTTTTRHGAYAHVFGDIAGASSPFVMMSTAIYSRIDPGVPAAFSRTIVGGMLRGDMHFDGVIVSDSLMTPQVSGTPVGGRAVRFLQAGGDLALTTDPYSVGRMTGALLARASNYPTFAKIVNGAALRVLEAKQAAGLLH